MRSIPSNKGFTKVLIQEKHAEWSWLGVVFNMLNCVIIVCKFDLKPRYYIHSRINTLGNGIKPFIQLCFSYYHNCVSS